MILRYPRLVRVGLGIVRVARSAAEHRRIERETRWANAVGVPAGIALAALIVWLTAP